MRIGFLVLRDNYFGFFGVLIDQALKRGHKVFCFHYYGQTKKGSKAYQFPSIEKTPVFLNGKVFSLPFNNPEDLKRVILESRVNAVISLDFTEENNKLKSELKEKGIYWVALQNGFDAAVRGTMITIPDLFFAYSKEWLKLTSLCAKNKFCEISENTREGGFWPAQQKSLIDKQEVRKKWSIPKDKKVVLFLPFPFNSSIDKYWTRFVFGMNFPFWQKIILRILKILRKISNQDFQRFLNQVHLRENDKRLTMALKKFCDKNNAMLIVKCRKKDPPKRYLRKVADKTLFDENFYPSTIMECMAVSDICFNFYSTAAIEAASSGVVNVCIAPEVSDWKDIQTSMWKVILSMEKDYFDFEGVSYLRTISGLIKDLPNLALTDFPMDDKKRLSYLEKFAGNDLDNPSEKIISEIEKLFF